MIEQFTQRQSVSELPSGPVNLSARIRDLRARRGLKQSEIARKIGVDASIPSLWEQGKRPVPANRIAGLAEALDVTVDELLQGASDLAQESQRATPPAKPREQVPAALSEGLARAINVRASGLITLVSHRVATPAKQEPAEPAAEPPAPRVFVPAPRPPLDGWVPEGWSPSDRVQDIAPSLPDGYWLDPVALEKRGAKRLLRTRLCPADHALIGDRDVPGAALAERLYQHCSKDPAFTSMRLPFIETLFRVILASDYAGLPVDSLVEELSTRTSALTITSALLRRVRDSVRPYPLRWVDRELFA